MSSTEYIRHHELRTMPSFGVCSESQRRSAEGLEPALDLLPSHSLVFFDFVPGLDAEHPFPPHFLVLIISAVIQIHGFPLQGLEVHVVLRPHVADSQTARVLHMDQVSETGLGFEDHERDVLLHAECRHPQHQLNGVHIVGDEDEFGAAPLDLVGHVVQSHFDDRPLLVRKGFTLRLQLRHRPQSEIFLAPGFWSVVLAESDQFRRELLGAALIEEVEWRGDLKALQ